MRGPVRFREREASRAVRAAEKAGLTVERIEVAADGRLSLVTSRGKQEGNMSIIPLSGSQDPPKTNEWDTVLDKSQTKIRP
jgi:hypothetical protein